ncbi:MAG: hypothetical protein MPK36_00110 [Gammaproteobacteria bacterium]|nr:hypothetical protein [Gammaproteobacteria bacterium]
MQIHGHRGARGRRPENTLAALAYALENGADGVEVDVCVTADDRVVLHHDLRLNPAHTRGARGEKISGDALPAIRELSLAELRRYDVGAADNPDGARCVVPTLEECLEFLSAEKTKGAVLNLEMKGNWKLAREYPKSVFARAQNRLLPAPERYVSLVLECLRRMKFPPERLLLQSFDWRLMLLAKKLRPELNIGLTMEVEPSEKFSPPQLVKQHGGDVWSCEHTRLREASVAEAHSLGLEVCAWTVNDAAAMRRLWGWGVDVITTDDPKGCRGVSGADTQQ